MPDADDLTAIEAWLMLDFLRRSRKPVCGCGHHVCFHADGTGACAWVGYPRHVSGVGEFTPKCACLAYVGPK